LDEYLNIIKKAEDNIAVLLSNENLINKDLEEQTISFVFT
jgi:hypothetical protein